MFHINLLGVRALFSSRWVDMAAPISHQADSDNY